MIDHQFEYYTVNHFHREFMLYLTFYVTPLLVMVFSDSLLVNVICTILCLVSQTGILYIEKIHHDEQGSKEYFKELWNQIDIVMLAFNYLFLAYNSYLILFEDFSTFRVDLKADDPRLETQQQSLLGIGHLLIPIVVVCFAFFKIMFYLRVYQQFG